MGGVASVESRKGSLRVLLDRHNKHMCYMVSFEAAPCISLAAAADLCPLHSGMSCVGPEGVAYSH